MKNLNSNSKKKFERKSKDSFSVYNSNKENQQIKHGRMEDLFTNIDCYLCYKGKSPSVIKMVRTLDGMKSTITIFAEYASDMGGKILVRWIFYLFKIPASNNESEYLLSCFQREEITL